MPEATLRDFRALLAGAIALLAGASSARAEDGAPAADSPGALGAAVPADGRTVPDARAPFPGAPAEPRSAHALSLHAGPSWVRFAGVHATRPALPSVALEWSHVSARLARLSLEVGARGALLVAPYEGARSATRGTSLVWSGLGIARIALLGERWEIAAGLGVGLSLWSGLGEDNPFTAGGAPAGEPLLMPSLCAGLDLRIDVGKGWWLGLAPRLAAAATSGPRLAGGARRLDRLDLALAAGVRL